MHRLFCMLFVVVVCLGAPAAARQDEASTALLWTSWLYEPSTGRVTLVDSAGETVLAFHLRLPSGITCDSYPDDVAVSPDGTLLGYMVTDSATEGQELVVADWRMSKFLLQYLLPSPPDDEAVFATPLRIAFHETDETLALGRELYNPETRFSMYSGDQQEITERDVSLAVGYRRKNERWTVIVLNPLAGGVRAVLHSHSALTRSVDIPEDGAYLPVVQRYYDDKVVFTLVPAGKYALPRYDSYVWDLTARTVSQTVAYLTLPEYTDTLESTGEVIMAMYDDRLSHRQEDFEDDWHRNTLYIYDPATGSAYPFFHDPAFSLVAPRFVQNDTRIVVGVMDENGKIIRWRVVRRDGSTDVRFFRVGAGGVDAMGTPTGYIVLGRGGHGEAFLLDTDTLNQRVVSLGHILWFDDQAVAPRLLWVQNGTAPDDDESDTPWAQLADPVYDGGED
ncbi:MAG: hypothetical protein JXB47_05830 [Anaerolineae bacterium]|nr:hypothetical protein [Anaerolineae bacterium]